MYGCDERIRTRLIRTKDLGLDIERKRERGLVGTKQVAPAEMIPGEFTHRMKNGIRDRTIRLVVLDGLAGYPSAMPNERLL
ncbi:MAG: hypothetical protein ACQESR_03110 [Planctomycetota bacterium]